MNTPSELTTFKGSEDARKFFYLYENVVTNSLPDSERAEKIVAYQSDAAFDFYFDRFNQDNAPTEEAKDYGLVKKVMLEKFSTQNRESEIMREAMTLQYDGGDIPTFLSRAEKVYNQAKVGQNVKFELLRSALKSDQMFFQFVLFRESKNNEGIKKACMEDAEKIKMMDGTAAPSFQQTKKLDKNPKEIKIDELCEQVENLHLMMMKQPRQAPKQAEPVCYKFGKKGHYASQSRMEQDLHVTNAVRMAIELLSVAQKSIYHLCARIATGLATLLKTGSSRGATKL